MRSFASRTLIATGVVAGTAADAHAQTGPPIKPGLWQHPDPA